MGHVTQYGHDAEENLDAVILPDPKTGGAASDGSTKTSYGHDYDGNLTVATNPQLNSTFYAYDDLNQKIQETDPPPTTGAASPVTTWQFDDEKGIRARAEITFTNSYWPVSRNLP